MDNKQNAVATKGSNNYLAIGIMFFLFAMISFVTGLQNPMGVIVKTQFSASNLMSQLGNFMNFFAYLFMGYPAGLILKKYGYKITSLAAVTVGFIGVGITFLSGQTGAYWVYLVGAFISGFAMCMLNTVVNPMLNTLGGGGNKGNQLIQWGGSLNSLFATIVPILVGYLIADATKASISDANPALFIAMGIFALAFIVIIFSKIPEPELEARRASGETEDEGAIAGIKATLSYRNLVFGIIAIFLYVGIEVGIPNISNLYMTSPEIGVTTGVAGTVVGMYWLLMLVGRLVGASIGAKVSSRTMMICVSAAAIVLILIGMFVPEVWVRFPAFNFTPAEGEKVLSLVQIPLGVVFFVLCGLCTSIMWGAIFNLAVEGLGKYTSIASGLFMVMVVGGGILPLIQGWIADVSSYINSFWVLIIALIYILWFAVFGSKVVRK